MYESPQCSKPQFSPLHSQKFEIGRKLALKWTKNRLRVHKCILVLSRIASLGEAFLFRLCHIAGKVLKLSKGNLLGQASMQNLKINLLCVAKKGADLYYIFNHVQDPLLSPFFGESHPYGTVLTTCNVKMLSL